MYNLFFIFVINDIRMYEREFTNLPMWKSPQHRNLGVVNERK